MEEIKKAIMAGVSSRPEVGVGRTMTPTASAILLLLVLGAKQNLRNDDNIVIAADDVQGYYPLADVDDCIWGWLLAPVRIISCRVAAAPRSTAFVCADRADAVFRLVL